MRELILSKLSLRELASAGRTCREMRTEFLTRLAQERARLVSAGEEFLGKKMFSSYVTAFQDLMRSLDAFPALVEPENSRRLLIDGAGEHHIHTFDQPMPEGPGDLFFSLTVSTHHYCPYVLQTQLWSPLRTSGGIDGGIDVRRVRNKQELMLVVSLCPHSAAATLGLLLAICGHNAEAGPALWQRPLNTIELNFHGSWGAEGKAQAEDLVGPLRSLGRTFKYYTPATSYGAYPGRKHDGVHAASKLVVMWSVTGYK